MRLCRSNATGRCASAGPHLLERQTFWLSQKLSCNVPEPVVRFLLQCAPTDRTDLTPIAPPPRQTKMSIKQSMRAASLEA
jgi:hypothetical protein